MKTKLTKKEIEALIKKRETIVKNRQTIKK